MMNWGRKKPSSASSSSTSSSSSHPHLISHVFPLSWLSKFKRTSDKAGPKTPKKSQKEKQQKGSQRVISSVRSPKHATYNMDSRFYTQDNDGFWRLSFNEENTGDVNKLPVPEEYFGNCHLNVKEVAAAAAATKKRSQKSNVPKTEILPEREAVKNEAAKNESLQRTYRRIMEATEGLHRELDEVNEYRKSVEKELSNCELLHVMQMMGRADQRLPYSDSSKKPSVVSGDSGSYHQERFDGNDKTLEWQKLKDAKIKEVLSKNDKHRKSFHVSKGSSNNTSSSKVRVSSSPKMSPLRTEICKVKALESMKKAKMRKKIKELHLDEKAAGLGSFAVVKSSCDPQQDFRDSMLEMIKEKRIRRPEELEELLACFLTLNADEYHDLIIKVFRQVWCELEEA